MALWRTLQVGRQLDTRRSEFEAIALSDYADTTMHPDKKIHLALICNLENDRDSSGLVITPFHLSSLDAYLKNQDSIKRIIQNKVVELAPVAVAGTGTWWDAIVSIVLELAPRNVLSKEELAVAKSLLGGRLKAKESPATASAFAIRIQIAWDQEHLYYISFLDNKMISCGAQ